MKKNNNDLDKIRHSSAHLLAAAVMKLWPDTKPTIGPVIEDGFYYDFEFKKAVKEEDLKKIEDKMIDLVKSWTDMKQSFMTKEEALRFYKDNEYKKELISEIDEKDEKLSFYSAGKFKDLCRGPHVENPAKELGHFKLLSIAGAYWRGDEKNKMLTRIYGTAFEKKKDLEQHLKLLEEIKERDHRKIGKEMELFTFSDQIGAGLPLWMPKGTIIKDELEKWGVETENEWGYKRVATPFLTKRKLFETSGHVPYFEDEMYKVKVPGEDKEDYFIKPMNCPFHHMIYKARKRSYRELPLRLAEYGTVARYEQAGALNGILRPRVFCQNDAHVYCTEEQAVDEFIEIINLHRYYYDKLGLKDYYIVLALRDPKKKDKYHGNDEMWKKSEEMSIESMEKAGIKFKVENEGAAHYGPKMDFKIKSAIGTEYGISTNQIDFYMPERFGLKYIAKDSSEKPVVVQHRAPLGSSERFVGFLIEHYKGAFPAWLAPTQVKILPVSDKSLDYAQKLSEKFDKNQIRYELDDVNETLGNKIRKAEVEKVPYMLIVGEKEAKDTTVSVRSRDEGDQGAMQSDNFIQKVQKEILDKK